MKNAYVSIAEDVMDAKPAEWISLASWNRLQACGHPL